MNYKTFLVFFFLALPVRFSELANANEHSFTSIVIAIIVATVIAVFWSIVAGWIRSKYAKNLSESYINKIQITFILIGLVMTVGSVVNLN